MKYSILLYFLITFSCNNAPIYSSVIDINDYFIPIDTTEERRWQRTDERDFILSPNKRNLLIVGHPPKHTTVYSVPISLIYHHKNQAIRKDIMNIGYVKKDSIISNWIDNQTISISYPISYQDMPMEIYNEKIKINKHEIIKISFSTY